MPPNPLPEVPPINEIAELVGPTWSEERAGRALHALPPTLAARCDAGTLLGLVTNDESLVYPVFQFHRRSDGQVEVRPGLVPALQALRRYDHWTVAVLLNTPAPELSGSTPIEWVRNDGGPDVLRDLAEAVAREWAAGEASRV